MQLNRMSASEQIFEDIVEKIRQREILPGQKLVIKAIQDVYSVSSTPVRDALNKLYHCGFVDLRSSATANVITMTEADMYDLIALNEELTRMSFQLIMENGTIYSIRERLRQILQEEISLTGQSAGERIRGFVKFVNTPGSMTGNSFYSFMTGSLYGKSVVAFGDYTDVFDPDEALENNRLMVESLDREDWQEFQKLRYYMTDSFRKYLERKSAKEDKK